MYFTIILLCLDRDNILYDAPYPARFVAVDMELRMGVGGGVPHMHGWPDHRILSSSLAALLPHSWGQLDLVSQTAYILLHPLHVGGQLLTATILLAIYFTHTVRSPPPTSLSSSPEPL